MSYDRMGADLIYRGTDRGVAVAETANPDKPLPAKEFRATRDQIGQLFEKNGKVYVFEIINGKALLSEVQRLP